MIYDQHPVNYAGRRTEFMTNPDPSWGDLYLNFLKSGFSSTEFGLYQSFQAKGKYDKNSVFFDEEAFATTDVLTKDTFEASPFFDDEIEFHEGMTKAELRLYRERLDRERELAYMVDNADSFREWSAIGLGMLSGSLPSVMNFVPIVRGFKGLNSALTFAKMGKYGNRFLKGAVDAGIATSIINVPYAMDRRNYQLDYDLSDYITDVSIGAMLGGGIGTVLGRMYDGDVPVRSELFDDTQPLFTFRDRPDQPSLMETNAGQQMQRVAPEDRYAATNIASAQIRNGQPVDVGDQLNQVATNSEIASVVNDVVPNSSSRAEPDVGTAQAARLGKAASETSDPYSRIEIFDGEETNLVLLSRGDAKGDQIKIVPLTEANFKKHAKGIIRFLKEYAYIRRLIQQEDIELKKITDDAFILSDREIAKGSIKKKDLQDSDATLASYLQQINENYGYLPTHLHLHKPDGQKNFELLEIVNKAELEKRYNTAPLSDQRIQVKNFQNPFGQQWRKIKQDDTSGITKLAQNLRNYRVKPKTETQSLDNRVVPNAEAEKMPDLDVNSQRYEENLRVSEEAENSKFYNSSPTDDEIKNWEAVKLTTEKDIDDAADMIGKTGACVRQNG